MSGVDPHATIKDWNWGQFCAAVKAQSIPKSQEGDSTKREAMSFACAEFDPPYRKMDNLQDGSIWAVVLDLDAVDSPGTCREVLSRWTYIGWTTWSSEPGREKWRVVLPLKKPIGRSGLVRIVRWFSDRFHGIGRVDRASADAAHLWFFPWHRMSNRKHHRVWQNEGVMYSGNTVSVDFSDTPSTKPENVKEGSRNVALHRFLGEREGLECDTLADLLDLAMDWNSRLKDPMPRREVRDIVKKKWSWMTNDPHGIAQRARVRREQEEIEEDELDTWALGKRTVAAKAIPIIGDIIYPGCTLLTAKLKEGKSFLAAQLAFAMASGETFLNGANFPGFVVREPGKSIIVAGEDTRSTMATRLLGNVKAGHLPAVADGDVSIFFQENLLRLRERHPKMNGCQLLEKMLDVWYQRGARLVVLDPLRVVEAALGIVAYPGVTREMNAHTKEFLAIVYYNKLAEKYRDLALVVSLHHGKNKRDHNAGDPADMIAGTSGILAGAMTTMALVPHARGGEESGPKRRELYIHGRMTRERRLLVEQDERTGLWKCMGDERVLSMNETRETYMAALAALGAGEEWVTADALARRLGRKIETIHAVLGRMMKDGVRWEGRRVIAQRSRGYRLVG